MLSRHNNIEYDVLKDLSKDINLFQYDAIYIGGGNTFKLLKEVKENKFDEKIFNYLNLGGIIYGGSAGAIILGTSINICQLGVDQDKNKVKLKETNGLNLINDFEVQCHYDDSQLELHQRYNLKNKNSIIAIPEETVLEVNKDNFRVLGTKPITVIKNQKVKIYESGVYIKL